MKRCIIDEEVVVHPVDGMHQDRDDFSFGAAALSLLAAWCVAQVLGGPDHAADALG